MDPGPATAASGVRLISHDVIASTNADALSRARAGERGPLWITARQQSHGRGRRGRRWVSEPGNLYASLLLADPSAVEHAAELSFVAALALHDAIIDAAAMLGPRLKLKWPNDVLCDGAKVAGILVEGESAPGRPLVAVIGIGVNCANHPPATAYPATDLNAAGAMVAPEVLFGLLSCAAAQRLIEWGRGKGFDAIRTAWLARAAGLGDTIRVTSAEGEREGRFETLDPAGRLLLRLPDGTLEPVTAGEMSTSLAAHI